MVSYCGVCGICHESDESRRRHREARTIDPTLCQRDRCTCGLYDVRPNLNRADECEGCDRPVAECDCDGSIRYHTPTDGVEESP